MLALVVSLAAAVNVQAQQALPVQIDLDQAVFAYDSDQSLVEMYLAFEAATLTFEADSMGFRSGLPIDVAIMRATSAILEGSPGEAVWSNTLNLSFVVPDTSRLVAGQQFVHQVRATVPPGEYQIALTVPADPQAGRSEISLRREVVVPDFVDSDEAELSDITLATEIRRSDDREDQFYKNGLLVRPNANQLFGAGLNRVFYYAEAYNLDKTDTGASEYTALAYIAEANLPQPLPDLQRRTARPIRSPDVLVGYFDISNLPSGSYFLRMALLNSENESLVERSRKFYVYNPEVERAQIVGVDESFETSRFAAMTEEEVEKSFGHIELIATDGEKRRMKSISDLDERRRFLMEFWRLRDPNLATPINEFQEEFYQRLQYANDRYTNSFDEGWETDRGRVLVKYGTPAGIEMHLYDRGTRPYELWNYNSIPGEGQAVFVFADRDGFGQFEMIHSTVSGERKMANWLQELQR